MRIAMLMFFTPFFLRLSFDCLGLESAHGHSPIDRSSPRSPSFHTGSAFAAAVGYGPRSKADSAPLDNIFPSSQRPPALDLKSYHHHQQSHPHSPHHHQPYGQHAFQSNFSYASPTTPSNMEPLNSPQTPNRYMPRSNPQFMQFPPVNQRNQHMYNSAPVIMPSQASHHMGQDFGLGLPYQANSNGGFGHTQQHSSPVQGWNEFPGYGQYSSSAPASLHAPGMFSVQITHYFFPHYFLHLLGASQHPSSSQSSQPQSEMFPFHTTNSSSSSSHTSESSVPLYSTPDFPSHNGSSHHSNSGGGGGGGGSGHHLMHHNPLSSIKSEGGYNSMPANFYNLEPSMIQELGDLGAQL